MFTKDFCVDIINYKTVYAGLLMEGWMISYAALSRMGNREYNEDSIRVIQNNPDYLFAVADGLGGQGNGDIASKKAVEALNLKEDSGEIAKCISDNFEMAQNAVMDEKCQNIQLEKMMTTMVILQIEKDYLGWGHVGDSRLYYFENGKLVSRTLDHSVPQVMVSAKMIEESEIRHHPDRNRLLRSIGMEWEEPMYEVSEVMQRQGKQEFLLCSDGFWEYIEEYEMQRLLQHAVNSKHWLNRMERVVRKNGKGHNMDNYSAIVVWSKL